MKPSKKNGVNYVSATEQRHIYLDILYHYKLSFPETNASAYYNYQLCLHLLYWESLIDSKTLPNTVCFLLFRT